MRLDLFDARPCDLGEGPIWHPDRGQLFWFDITGRRLLWRAIGGAAGGIDLPEMHSAAGIIDHDRLLVASASGLWQLDLASGRRLSLCPIEADDARTRSNDGRADPVGGFWIGTMGLSAQPGAGSIWRWHRGELRRLWRGITIPNAICFTPDGRAAHFADTARGQVMKVALDQAGWPRGEPVVWLDMSSDGLDPDGAVIDAGGRFHVAHWGAGRVACHAPDGAFIEAVTIDAPHASCPAFGGADLDVMFCTSALQGMDGAARRRAPHAGCVFAAPRGLRGQPEHRVLLPQPSPFQG